MGDGDVKVSVSKSYISDRPKRLAQAKVQRLSRKTKNRKTKKRYARNLSRGNIRPKMRRQTGLVRVTIRKAEKKKEIGDLPDIGSLRIENLRNRHGKIYTEEELLDLTSRGRNLSEGQNASWDKHMERSVAGMNNVGMGRYVWSPSGYALNPSTEVRQKDGGASIKPNKLDIPRGDEMDIGLDFNNLLNLYGYYDKPKKWRYGSNNVEGIVRDDLKEEPINFGPLTEGGWAQIGRSMVEGKGSKTAERLSDNQKKIMANLQQVMPPISLDSHDAEYVNNAKDIQERLHRINSAHISTGLNNRWITGLEPSSQASVLSEGIPWLNESEYLAPEAYSVFTGEPMDLSFRLLKRQRQTELGEYGIESPTSRGPVTEYHGTMNLPSVLEQGITGGSPRTRSNRYVPKNLRNEESINYTTNDAEKAREFAEKRAISLGLNPADVGVVGVRGRDLSDSTEMDEPDGGILENTKSNVRAGNIPREYLVQASEPMEIAYQLLKDDDKPMPVDNPMLTERRRHIRNRLEDNQNAVSDSFQGTISPKQATLSARDKRKRMFVGATGREYETEEHRAAVEPSTETQEVTHYDWGYRNPQTKTEWAPPKPPVNPNVDEPYDEMYNQYYNVVTGEPMDIASQLLKERRSAKALANKKKYDTKYESSPERIKYRVELNRERRRRGIYGSGNGKDVSHTKGGKLTLENQSTNRARHFKNRGTLRNVKVKK